MTEEIATVNLVMLRGDIENRFQAMLKIPGEKYQKRLEITTLATEDDVHEFVRRWQLAAVENHCNFNIDFLYLPRTFKSS